MQRSTFICRRAHLHYVNNLVSSILSKNNSACIVSDATRQQRLKHIDNSSKPNEEVKPANFTGFIPVEQLEFSYSKSSGPGGQNVNKVSTKVEVRFHVPSAVWISEEIKTKLMEEQQNRITKDGYLVVSSDRTRKQILNQADVMDKLRSMLFKAAVKPRGLTKEEIELKDKRLAKSVEHTLRDKRHQSVIKQTRGNL